MPIPRAVREAEERASAIHAELYGQRETDDSDLEKQEQEEAPQPGSDNHLDEPGEQDDAMAPKKDELDPAPVDDGNERDWKAEYQRLEGEHQRLQQANKVLQGKYTAEVPRMAQQLRDLKAEMDQAKQQTEAAKTDAAQANAKLQQQLENIRAEFGDEFVGTMQSLVSEQASQEVERFKQESAQDREQRFWRDLRRMEPTFEQINVDPKFIQWLQSPNPATGFPYQNELDDAGADLDAPAVVDIVRQFQRAQEPKPQQQRTNPGAPEQQIAPKPGQTRSRQPSEKPAYTADDFTELQRQIQRGQWRGREAEARALEQEIHAALTGL